MPTLAAALNFNKLEALNVRVHNSGTAPSTPVAGQLWYDTGTNKLWWFNGTIWIDATGGAGAVVDATTSVKGIVQLAGDLAGTAASPQIAAGVITDADVNAANKDGAVGTASMRTLGAGAAQAMPGNRTLDAISAPAADLNLNNKRIVSLADPTGAQDGATKNYVDGVAAGLTWKQPVRLISTVNIGASPPGGPQTIDGVAVITGDRVLLTAQTVPADNGIWGVNTGGTWGRSTDADSSAELVNAAVLASQGTANADTGWVCTTNAPITVGTTALTGVQFSGPGEYIAGAGLLLTGKTFDVGAGAGITVNPDTIQVANNGITNAMIADGAIDLGTADVTGTLPLTQGGTGSTTAAAARTALASAGVYNNNGIHGSGTTITISAATHGLGSKRALIVQVSDYASGAVLLADVVVNNVGTVTITFAVSQVANSILVTIVG